MQYAIVELDTAYPEDITENDEGPIAATVPIVSEPFNDKDAAFDALVNADHMDNRTHGIVPIHGI